MPKQQITQKDRIIGKLIKQKRLENGISQSELAIKLGITFQQVQKYEKAINKISAVRLFEIANILKTKINYFMLNQSNLKKLDYNLSEKILKYFNKLDKNNKKVIIDLVKNLLRNKKNV